MAITRHLYPSPPKKKFNGVSQHRHKDTGFRPIGFLVINTIFPYLQRPLRIASQEIPDIVMDHLNKVFFKQIQLNNTLVYQAFNYHDNNNHQRNKENPCSDKILSK